MNSTKEDVLIIGAGIAGLTAALRIQEAGLSCRILEKGRGFGGRMSTRRWEGGTFDHGAQFFTCRDPRFAELQQRWEEAGILRTWFRKEDGMEARIFSGGMNAGPKSLAEGIPIERETRITFLRREGAHWIVGSESGRQWAGRGLILTAPLPQALELWDTTDLALPEPANRDLRNIRYTRCLAGMFVLEGPSGIPGPGWISSEDDEVIRWVADCQAKGISPNQAAVVCHSSPEFAEAHWDSSDAVRIPLIQKALEPFLKSPVRLGSCHRWGYSHCLNPYPMRFWLDEGLRAGFAGDAFHSARVEGAVLSGWEIAQALAAALQGDE